MSGVEAEKMARSMASGNFSLPHRKPLREEPSHID